MKTFEQRVAEVDPAALSATTVEELQLNLGLCCNLQCTHCHQSSSPDRTELMPDRVFGAALEAARVLRPSLVDLTGGAPELHPSLREYLAELGRARLEVQLRTNLTLLLEEGHQDLPELWARQGVRLLASLPSSDPAETTRQRGGGTFEKCIAALRALNALGYGTPDGLRLDLVSNPVGPALPGPAAPFEQQLRTTLAERHGVRFSSLLRLTNMPIGRHGEELERSGGRGAYLAALSAAFNPANVPRLACRRILAVRWDGCLFDCDFNIGAGMPVRDPRQTVFEADAGLASRQIRFGPHCFACTADAGSS